MDINAQIISASILFLMTMLINLPFGYFRKKAKRFSFRWFLYIHIPIPFIFFARVISQLDFKYIPLFALAAVIGQVAGGKLEL